MGDVRGSLAEGLAAAVTPEKVTALVDAALVATKSEWVSVRCPHCQRVKKHQVELSDPRTAAQVLGLLADQGFGRPGLEQGVAPLTARLIRSREELEALSDEELAAIEFADLSDEEFDAKLEAMRSAAKARLAAADGRLRSKKNGVSFHRDALSYPVPDSPVAGVVR